MQRVLHGTLRDSLDSKSTDSSADCDLDISFEATSDGSHEAPPHGVPETDMVRSPSGRLLGTTKRVKSAVELRAKYLEDERRAMFGEAVAIDMNEVETLGRTAWVRQGREGTVQEHGVEGFCFGVTEAKLVEEMDSSASRKGGIKQLRLATFGRTPASPTTTSPSWSMNSFFSKTSRSQGQPSPPSKSTWAGELARSAVAFVKEKGGSRNQVTTTASSGRTPTFPSPLFSSQGHGTAPSTPNDTPVMLQLHQDDDECVQETLERGHKQGGLTGLGFSFDGEDDCDADDEGLGRSGGPGRRSVAVQRKGHTAIPSLSITLALDDAHTSPADEMVDILLPRSRLDNLHPTERRPASPTSPAHKFSFQLAPLALSTHREQQPTHVPSTPPSATLMRKPSWRASLASFLSIAGSGSSGTSHVHESDLPLWETMPPAQVLFLLGFVLGPWLWLLGGWFVRSDGELFGQRGQRCRFAGCGCGALKAGGRSGASEELEGWVKGCRVASVGSGVVVAALTTTAVWAAVAGAAAA